jgi:hypothetical protein
MEAVSNESVGEDPASFVEEVADVVTGVALLFVGMMMIVPSALTFGQSEWVNQTEQWALSKGGLAVHKYYVALLGFLPWGKVEQAEMSGSFFLSYGRGLGVWAEEMSQSKSWAGCNLSARALHLCAAIATIPLGSVDAMVGIWTAVVSLWTLGCISTLNTVAVKEVTGLLFLAEMHEHGIKTIDPWAKGFVASS